MDKRQGAALQAYTVLELVCRVLDDATGELRDYPDLAAKMESTRDDVERRRRVLWYMVADVVAF